MTHDHPEHILGRAIGKCVSDGTGLTAAYLPPDIPLGIAAAVVAGANERRVSTPPFAILVSDSERKFVSGVEVISPRNAVQWRVGDRLAVFAGGATRIQSSLNTFASVIGPSFPSGPADGAFLKRLSYDALEEVLGSAYSVLVPTEREVAAKRIQSALQICAGTYEELGSGSSTWNCRWLVHCDSSLGALRQFLDDLSEDASLPQALDRFTFAAFGLPRLESNSTGLLRRTGKEVAEAVAEWWGSEDQVKNTVALLKHHSAVTRPEHALATIEWTGFDQTSAAYDGAFRSLATHGDARIRIAAFEELLETQFFSPLEFEDAERLQIETADGTDLSITGGPAGPFLLPLSEWDEEPSPHVKSVQVSILIPTFATPSLAELESSGLTIDTSRKSVTATCNLMIRDQMLVAETVFALRATAGGEYAPQTFSISTFMPPGDPLSDFVPSGAQATLYPTSISGPGLVLFRVSSNGRLSPGKFHGTGATSPEDQDAASPIWNVSLTSAAQHLMVAWTDSSAIPTLDGKQLGPIGTTINSWKTEFAPKESQDLRIGDATFNIVIADNTQLPFSPLLAAIKKTSTNEDLVPERARKSVRGLMEEILVDGIISETWTQTHGHHVVTGDDSIEGVEFELDEDGSVLLPQSVKEAWQSNCNFYVPKDLVTSSQAVRFRAAFDALGIPSLLSRPDADSPTHFVWTSQASWRDIDDAALAEYLNSYSALVDEARRTYDPRAVFWAAYPFSFSVWQLTAPARATAILLSPLHPIRLVWLSRFERTLYETPESVAYPLAGTVEGWNLPLIGPRESSGTRMMATPMDHGDEHLFAGWSMMVRLGADPEQLALPVKIAGRDAPGTSSSGLNASAVRSSMRDFRRLNPHLSTVSIDLCSPIVSARSSDIDGAVIEATQELVQDRWSPLPGGVRVFDSLNRQGNTPAERLRDMSEIGSRAPVVWKRYEPTATRPKTNITLLQDSGLVIQVADGGKAPHGVLSNSSLRRFEITDPNTSGGIAKTQPTLSYGIGWPPVGDALRAIEDSIGVPEVSTQIVGGAISSPSSEWTVSGEGLLNPVALSRLLASAKSSENHVLWEWRPPFLEAEQGLPALERRPYISVARVPSGLRQRLSERLSLATAMPASDDDANEVLYRLGTRGIGLSSLLSMGNNHATGAIGFYFTLRLLEELPQGEFERLVLPIDACDQFLLALASHGGTRNSQQRADLLVIDIGPDTVRLTPIEIKFFGIDNVGTTAFPKGKALEEPLSQLASTSGVLATLKAMVEQLSDCAITHQALWWNAFGCLLDAGLRLSPKLSTPRETLARWLQNVVDGNANIEIGIPILCLFQLGGTNSDGSPVHLNVDGAPVQGLPNGYKGYFADPASLFPEFDAPGPLVSQWESLWTPPASSPTPAIETPGATRPVTPIEQPTPNRTAEDNPAAVTHVADIRQGVRVPVGTFLDSKAPSPVYYWPGNTALNQLNVGVVGDLGTGKTQFLKTLIFQLRRESRSSQEQPISILTFDYKNDFQDEAFLKAVGGEVLRPTGIPLNVFALETPYTKQAAFRRAKAFVDVVARIYSGVGPVQSNRLTQVIIDLFEVQDGAPPTLSQVLDSYLHASTTADSVVSILNTFVLGEIFDDDPRNLVPFEQLISDKVLVLALAELGASQDTKNALVALFLNSYYEYMLSRTKWPYIGTAPKVRTLNSYLLVDEASNILKYDFETLNEILLQGREFGVGVILSTQYLSHFKVNSKNYGEPLNTWIIHKVPHVSPQQLAQLGLPNATSGDSDRIASLELHEAYYKSLDVDGRFIRGTPFFELSE